MGQEIDKKLKNEFFRVAVDYLYSEKKVNSQGELAEKIGISESALSRLMNDKKFVSDDTLRKMNDAFGGIFNMAYFRGETTKMLIEDAAYYEQHPEEDQLRDFDAQLKRNAQQQELQKQIPSAFEYSFARETIAVLRQQIVDKDTQIADLRADKERLINESDAKSKTIDSLQARIHELETYIKNVTTADPLHGYPFAIGVADKGDTDSTRV